MILTIITYIKSRYFNGYIQFSHTTIYQIKLVLWCCTPISVNIQLKHSPLWMAKSQAEPMCFTIFDHISYLPYITIISLSFLYQSSNHRFQTHLSSGHILLHPRFVICTSMFHHSSNQFKSHWNPIEIPFKANWNPIEIPLKSHWTPIEKPISQWNCPFFHRSVPLLWSSRGTQRAARD